jgi:hypothetical protein
MKALLTVPESATLAGPFKKAEIKKKPIKRPQD